MIKVDRPTAARALKKLEKNGFIEKKEDAHKKKIKKLFPTQKGERVYPFIRKRLQSIFPRMGIISKESMARTGQENRQSYLQSEF